MEKSLNSDIELLFETEGSSQVIKRDFIVNHSGSCLEIVLIVVLFFQAVCPVFLLIY